MNPLTCEDGRRSGTKLVYCATAAVVLVKFLLAGVVITTTGADGETLRTMNLGGSFDAVGAAALLAATGGVLRGKNYIQAKFKAAAETSA